MWMPSELGALEKLKRGRVIMAQKRKHKHYEPWQLKNELRNIAREKRMKDRTPWTAMGIITGYSLLKSEGFTGKKIANIANTVQVYEERFQAGEITVEGMYDRVMEKADFSLNFERYTLDDIKKNKNSFGYWLDSIQIDAQNDINDQATRYAVFFFNALIDDCGYGKKRLSRVRDHIMNRLNDYQKNWSSLRDWTDDLRNEAGLVYEMPLDPLTQKRGSSMTGQ